MITFPYRDVFAVQMGFPSASPDDIWPAEFTVKLWHHPAWGHFKGFGTNTDETALLFDGMGVIRQQ